MDSILTFVALRRPLEKAPAGATLAADTDFQSALGAATDADARTAAAKEFVAVGHPVRSQDDVDRGAELLALSDLLSDGAERTANQVAEAVRGVVGNTDSAVRAGDLQRSRDTVVAAYVLGAGELDGRVAVKIVRALSVAEAVQVDPASRQVTDIVRAPLLLPDSLVGRHLSGAPAPEPEPPDAAAQRMLESYITLRDQHVRIADALSQVAAHDEDELVLRELDQERPLADLYRSTPPDRPRREGDPRQDAKVRDDEAISASPLRRAALRSNVVMSETAVRLLTEPAAETLRSFEIDPATASVRDIHVTLSDQHQQVGQQLDGLVIELSRAVHVGKLSDRVAGLVGDTLGRYGLDPIDDPSAVEPIASAPPMTKTDVRPLGTGDLCVVRTHIERYDRGEVAHLENVLPGEKLTHTLSQQEEVESTDTSDSEQTSLQSMAQSAAEQNTSKTTAQAVGAGRGPLTSDGPETFSKSVMEQVSSSSTNRTRKTSVLRQLRRTEDTAEHVLENTTHNEPLLGVYQWLDKIYQAQVFTYGSRLLYDLIVPEPAALFREALSRPRGQGAVPPKPAAFTVAAIDLSTDNWSYYVTGHRATGVDAPPEAQVVVTENFGQKAPDPNSGEKSANTLEIGETRKTAIPKGYRAASYRVVALASGWTSYVLRVLVGSKVVIIDDWSTKVFSGKLNDEIETIPVGLIADGNGQDPGLSTLSLGVEILCVPTIDAVAAWQTKTHGQILTANQRRFADYEERIAERDAMARLQLQSLTAAQKRTIIGTELKRTTLAVLTNQNFSGFNAMRLDSLGYPYPDAAATVALSPYIRFLEQAVEWDHLQHSLLPYFWGSRTSWMTKLTGLERDPQFASFLSSGAARVVLPIRRNFEAAFEAFLNTGVPPTTDEQLDVGGPLWVSLMTQLAEHGATEDQETALGDSWEFRIASDLVRVRRDDRLPMWTLTGSNWVEKPDPNS